MRLGKFLFVLMLLGMSVPLFAQRGGVVVTGRVLEKSDKSPVEQATVRLLSVKDSVLVRGTITSSAGGFNIPNVKAGSYLLHISFVGFDPIYQPIRITGKVNPVSVGELEMTDSGIQLNEAIVVGKAPEVVMKNDTMEYNADSYKVTEGSVLEDLLKKMPGVEVDSNGKVTVNGKDIKKVLIDGKEFFSDDPKVASKNLPAKMIDKVQVLDKKSDMAQMTGFDDGDEETVINLTVKPGMKQGWFGNAFAGYGSKDRYEGNAMVNRFLNNDQMTLMGGLNNTNNMGFSDLASTMFSGMGGGRRSMSRGAGSGITASGNAGANFSKQFNPSLTLGGNGRYSHSDNDAYSKSSQEEVLPDGNISRTESVSETNTRNDNVGANFRMEWKPDTLTTIIFQPNLNYSRTHQNEMGTTITMNGTDTINNSNSEYYANGEGFNASANLEFSRKLNNEGRVLSASLSAGGSDSYSKGNNLSNTEFLQESSEDSHINQRFRNDNKGFNYRIHISWVEPLGRNNFLQATYSFSQNKQESLRKTYSWVDEDDDYTRLDTAYSKSYRNNFRNQRASLSFKSVRERFNYTIGMSLDPSYTGSRTFVGDSILYDRGRNVLNFSPMAQFNYVFDKRTNLRIRYNGRTSQPSITQLQPIEDLSDPLNIVKGNPDLNPTYSNDLSVRFSSFSPLSQRALMVVLNGNYVINDIVSSSVLDRNTGVKTTSYKNVNGNFGGNFRVMLNTPLRNKKFSINTMTMASYANSNGYTNDVKNTNKNFTAMERCGIDFRSDIIDLGLNGNIRYNSTRNSLQEKNNLDTYNYGIGGNTTIYLPVGFKLESDVNWSTNSGYSDGFKQNEILWNASASKTFLKNNQGTLRFKIYDILQQRSNISRSVTANYTRDTEYNTLNSYFMVHFIYRFSIFKGGASASDMRTERSPHGGGEGRGRMRFN